MELRYTGLPPEPFTALFGLDDETLAARNIRRVTADSKPGYPCRVTMQDAEPGETLLLLAYEHQPAASPYRASGPIFVREAAGDTYDSHAVPPVFLSRQLSVRGYNDTGDIVVAGVVDGDRAEALFKQMLEREDVAYLHVHNAGRGCYAGRVERA